MKTAAGANYWPEIDGLRAMAILAVMLYHFKRSFFSGGYVGVDVFFVISGFLIANLIFDAINKKKFSLSYFFEGRIRRIFPALFANLIFCLLVSFLFFDFASFVEFGKSMAASSFFVSNVYFWLQSGYFQMPAGYMPLLHTWSLAIEEQFYIFFPFFILLISRLGTKMGMFFFSGVLLVSLSICIYSSYRFPSACFYLLPTRIWEFMTGALICFIPAGIKFNKYLVNLLQLTGACLILISVINFDDSTRFPGVSTLLPVTGAAFIIYFRGYKWSLINAVLRLKPIVFVGLISYSLYLWHWPIYCFYNYIFGDTISLNVCLVLVALTFVLSVFSWLYIERPFRRGSNIRIRRRTVYLSFGGVMIFFASAGMLIAKGNGFPGRFKENMYLMELAKTDTIYEKLAVNQYLKAKSIHEAELPYKFGYQPATPSFIVWGDSHARALYSGIDSVAKAKSLSGYITTLSSRGPLLGVDMKYDGTQMSDFNSGVLNFISTHPEIKTIILIGRWVGYTKAGYEFSSNARHIPNIDPPQDSRQLLEYGLSNTIKNILNLQRKVVVITNVPELKYDIRNMIGKLRARHFFGLPIVNDIAMRAGNYDLVYKESLQFFSKFTSASVKVIHIENALLLKDHFAYFVNNRFLYDDQNHLSKYGSMYVARAYNDIFE